MGKSDMKKGFIEIETEKLALSPRNYKEMEGPDVERMLDALENNFKRNGQVENILVRQLDTGFFEVINGNHRLVVAKRLKMEKLMCFNFGEISEAQADRVTIETNETKFKADNMKLAEVINSLTLEFDKGELAMTLPYTMEEIDNFTNLLNFDWEGDGPSSEGSGSGEKEDFRKIVYDLPAEIADEFDCQVERFKKILYPDAKTKDVSHILPIEAMIQSLRQIPDSHILGKEK